MEREPVEPEVDLVQLPDAEWRRMLSAAAELDLIRGGNYRARPQGILFYCTPENAPVSWEAGFADGSPDLPRGYVGQAEVEGPVGENELVVRLSVSNWTAMRAVKQAWERGEYRGRFEQYVADQETALRGRREDRRWLREQFRRLRAYAGGGLLD